MTVTIEALDRLAALIDRLRPADASDSATATQNIRNEIARLSAHPVTAATLAGDLAALLALPRQTAFYAETGVRSALGFSLELAHRVGERLLPRAPDPQQLSDQIGRVFRHEHDHLWVAAVDDELWIELATLLGFGSDGFNSAIAGRLLESIRVLSYLLAGTALDRELLRAEPALERFESPFLAQNASLLPLLERARTGGPLPSLEEVREVDVLLDQCEETLDRVRRRSADRGVSVRLTYQLARMRQLLERLHTLIDICVAEQRAQHAVRLFKTLLAGEQTQHEISRFLGNNVSLLARNVTDHASRQGGHYIANDRAEWWAIARSASGGGIIIAVMAMIKLRLGLLDMPPLTEGIAFGLNYGIGFVLIYLLGFTVATKQPAMTAAAIASTLEETRPRDLERLGVLAQNVVRTQFVAVLGNVGLAFPVACLILLFWQLVFGAPPAPAEKLHHLLTELNPVASGALFFAAIAGIGLFLSGLVSGFFDNQARYDQLAQRVSVAPALAWLGAGRAARLGAYLDEHYGAILGNLFFGMYLGLVGHIGALTGLPIDIRHVAFSTANIGTALSALGSGVVASELLWAVIGVIGIALINLGVSFTLALYVAMKSRRLGTRQIVRLAGVLAEMLLHHPMSFFGPPPPATPADLPDDAASANGATARH